MTLSADSRVRLINGRFLDVENGCYFGPQVSLVIQGGRIAAMPGLPGEPESVPAQVTIDLQGKVVIPGLFNTHCHLQIGGFGKFREEQIGRNLADCLERGITHLRDTLAYDLNANRVWIDRIGRGEVRGPRIVQAIHVTPAGGTYAPRQTLKARLLFSAMGLPTIEYGARQSGVVTFAPGASAQEVRDAVDRAIDERGAEVIKLCDQPEHFLDYKPGAAVPTGEQMAAAADQARRRGLPSTMHNVTLAGFRHGIEAGLNSLAHLPMDGTLTEADALRLLRSVTFIEPTVTVGYYMSYSMKGSPFAGHPEIARLDTLRDATMAERVAESWLPALQESKLGYHRLLKNGEMKLYGFMDLSEPYRFYSRLIPVGGQNLRLLVQQGAGKRLGSGSDAGPVACSPSVIYQELSMLDFVLNQDGHRLFTPADALRVATIQSAHALGKDEQYGSIAPGKVADLALLDGDPLQDLSLIGKPVQALFMGGKLVINRCGLVVAPC